jgi:hypothetical protein
MAEAKERTRYAILPVDVTSAGQIIRLDRKLPAHLTICKGIHVTVKNFLNTPSNVQHIGEISLLFNSGQVHPFHHIVGYNKNVLGQKNRFLPLTEELIPNSRIRGFYLDSGNSLDSGGHFLPYTVNIYLYCKALP